MTTATFFGILWVLVYTSCALVVARRVYIYKVDQLDETPKDRETVLMSWIAGVGWPLTLVVAGVFIYVTRETPGERAVAVEALRDRWVCPECKHSASEDTQ